jgi:hypothetical protein
MDLVDKEIIKVQKFCKSENIKIFNSLTEYTRNFFMKVAAEAIKKNKGNLRIAKLITPVVIKTPKKISISPPKDIKVIFKPNMVDMCKYYADNILTEEQRKIKWTELLKETKKIPNNFTKLDVSYIKVGFDAIDKIYFHGILWYYVWFQNSTLEFIVSNKMTKTAGCCNYIEQNSYYSIKMAQNIFLKMFTKNEMKYIANGLPCYNKKECFLSTLQHEIIHLLLFRFCRNVLDRSEYIGHSSHFKKIAFNLFGHISIKHGFLIEKGKGDELSDIEIKKEVLKLITLGETVSLFNKGLFILEKYNPKSLGFVIPNIYRWTIKYRYFYNNYDKKKKKVN